MNANKKMFNYNKSEFAFYNLIFFIFVLLVLNFIVFKNIFFYFLFFNSNSLPLLLDVFIYLD